MIDYYNETVNNYNKTRVHLENNGVIEIACVYCVQIYAYLTTTTIKSNNDTMLCHECGMDTMIPILPESALSKDCATYESQIRKLCEWHNSSFKRIKKDILNTISNPEV
jgi:hypothetical protein